MQKWRKLYKEGLNNLYPSTSIVRVIEWRVWWVRHIWGEWEMYTNCRL